ncbi:MAG: glycosyltransferase family 2 protein [Pelomonas sp.]|nr:glycosyltransferase family 2 protein [Roseateles sp.]
MIAVVIPFFQRQPGVLARALRSVAAQQGCALPLRVVVVDDASPVRARDELASAPRGLEIQLIEQANAGPGGARNTALAALGADVDYVAYLDSDDEWSVDHLANACCALERGFDVYFANHLQLGAEVAAFERGGRLDLARHPALEAPAGPLHAFGGDMVEQIVCGNVIGTSTVVYRRAGRAGQRFRTEYRRAGEDYLFWLELASGGARFAFSTAIEARYGRGVNIFAGVEWGSPAFLERTVDELRYRRTTLAEFACSAAAAAEARAAIERLRLAHAGGLLHVLRHEPGAAPRALCRYLHVDPLGLLKMPWLLVRAGLSGAASPC